MYINAPQARKSMEFLVLVENARGALCVAVAPAAAVHEGNRQKLTSTDTVVNLLTPPSPYFQTTDALAFLSKKSINIRFA